jgi:putative FmdB family regulatory protein
VPLYEYFCEKCDKVFEALGSFASSDQPAKCPTCGRKADRIMPTSFASMARTQGYKQRVPYHHHSVRGEEPKMTIARVKAKDGAKPKGDKKRKTKTGAKKTGAKK